MYSSFPLDLPSTCVSALRSSSFSCPTNADSDLEALEESGMLCYTGDEMARTKIPKIKRGAIVELRQVSTRTLAGDWRGEISFMSSFTFPPSNMTIFLNGVGFRSGFLVVDSLPKIRLEFFFPNKILRVVGIGMSSHKKLQKKHLSGPVECRVFF